MKRICALFLLLMLLLSACSAEAAVPSAPELIEPVQAQPKTATVHREDLLSATSMPGNIALYAEAVAFNVDGTLKDLYVTPGQQVKKGDVLATLNMDSSQLQLDSLLELQENTSYTNALTLKNLQIDIDICQLKLNKLDATHQAALAEKNAMLLQLQTALEQLRQASASAIEALTQEAAALQTKLSDPAITQEEADQLRSELTALETRIEQTKLADAATEADAATQIQKLEAQIGEVTQQQSLERKLYELDLEDAQLARKHTGQTQALAAKKLENQIQLLQEKLSNATVTAPFDGTVTWIISGKKVTAQEAVLYITDTDRYYIRTTEYSEPRLTAAQELYALIGNERFKLTYTPLDLDERLYRTLNDITLYSYYAFEPDAQVPESMNAYVFCVHGYREDVLCIPTGALHHDTSGAYVYKQVDGQRQKTYIKTGISTDLRVEVISGLEEGDVVYVTE